MIGYLEGILRSYSGNVVIVNVNGVGYRVEITGGLGKISPGERISLYIYTYVREDTLKLYGFEKDEERKLFSILLSVSGIGPGVAVKALSCLSFDRFINAVLAENLPVLKEVPGIGPKTAKRLVLELQDKAEKLAGELQINEVAGAANQELYEALMNLGYSRAEIDRALQKLDLNCEMSIEDKIKAVLSHLGKESFN